jgi:mono/diheme cytochrome c family protein
MLKPFLLVSAVALVVLALVVSPAGAPAQAGGAKAAAKSTAPDSQAKAKKIYAMDCALCHGDNGDGKTDLAKDMQLTLADWTDPKSLADKPDQALFGIIRNGKGKMPAEETGRAKDDEVRGLIEYIRTFSKNAPATPAATPAAPAPAAPSGVTATTSPSNR